MIGDNQVRRREALELMNQHVASLVVGIIGDQ